MHPYTEKDQRDDNPAKGDYLKLIPADGTGAAPNFPQEFTEDAIKDSWTPMGPTSSRFVDPRRTWTGCRTAKPNNPRRARSWSTPGRSGNFLLLFIGCSPANKNGYSFVITSVSTFVESL